MSTTVKITIQALGLREKTLSKEMKANIKTALGRAGKEGKAWLGIASMGVRDLGGYRTGWRYKVPSALKLKIHNAAPNAIYVENGRKPMSRPPPFAPMLAWGLRHGFDKSMIWALCHKIGREGIKARPILTQNTKVLADIVASHLADVVVGQYRVKT